MGRAKKRRIYGRKFPHIRKNIFAYAEFFFCAHGNFPPSARRHFSLRKAPFFCAEGGEFSKVGKFVFQAWKIFFLGRKISFRPKENGSPWGRKKIALRKEKHFLPKGEKCRAHAEKFPSARKKISLRKKIFFLAEGNFAPCPQRSFTGRKAGEKRAFARLDALPSEGQKERAGSAVAKPALLRLRRGKGKTIAHREGRE